MPWGAQSWVRLTREATYGVFDAGAIAANIIWARLYSNNGCTIRAVPQRQVIRSADGGNRRRQVVSSRKVVAGNINTLFYPTQAAFWLAAAVTLTSNDLFSYTIDFWDTIAVHRFLGCKVHSLSLMGTAAGDFIPVASTWMGSSQTTTTLADPGPTVFPTENPYSHIESKGLLSIGGVATKYSAMGVSIKNTLDGSFDEDQYITSCFYAGRDVDLTVRLQAIDIQCFYDQAATTDISFTVA